MELDTKLIDKLLAGTRFPRTCSSGRGCSDNLTDFAPTKASKSRSITRLDDCPSLKPPTDSADEA